MKRKFKHLSYEERVAISFLHSEGWSIRKIANRLGRHYSCIAYELKQKKVGGIYTAKKAHHKTYWRRYRSKRECMKVALDGKLSRFVVNKLKENWSPERISGYLKKEGLVVSTKAIYKFVYSRCLERYLFWRKHNVKRGRKRIRYGKISDERQYIEFRSPLSYSGDLEADFIVSSQSPYSLLVIVDRYNHHTWIKRIPNRKHATVLRVFQNALYNLPS